MRPAYPIIRTAASHDIGAIRAMQEISLCALGAHHYAPEEIAAFLTHVGTLDDRVVAEGHFFVALDTDGAILGSGGWSRLKPAYGGGGQTAPDPHRATVRSVFVAPSAARRGIGSAIMRHVEADSASHGVTWLTLTATRSGIPLYAALGYAARGWRSLDLPGAVRFACQDMDKPLSLSRAA